MALNDIMNRLAVAESPAGLVVPEEIKNENGNTVYLLELTPGELKALQPVVEKALEAEKIREQQLGTASLSDSLDDPGKTASRARRLRKATWAKYQLAYIHRKLKNPKRKTI